jgi:hypothetical protein
MTGNSGLAEAKFGTGKKMLESSSVLTTNFKTRIFYGFQAMTVPPWVKPLLKVTIIVCRIYLLIYC